METRVLQWDDGLVLRIPKSLANQVGLEPDSPVELSLRGTELVIVPATSRPIKLNDLLAQVTEHNIHGEIDCGPPVGREAW